MSERVRVKITSMAHECGRCGADVVPELRDGEPWLSFGESPEIARLRAEVERVTRERIEDTEGWRSTLAASEAANAALLGALREVDEKLTRVLAGADLPTCGLCERCWEDTTRAQTVARAAIALAEGGAMGRRVRKPETLCACSSVTIAKGCDFHWVLDTGVTHWREGPCVGARDRVADDARRASLATGKAEGGDRG